jgi:signal transduction histidine kinase
LSKLEAGKMVLNRDKGDLADIFENCSREQEQRMKDLSLKLKIIRPDYPVTGFFDVKCIEQVTTNLLSNAIKFSPKNGLITATINKNDNEDLCFSIQNEGINIPEDELETIFDAFIQSRKTKTGAGGTGLGLAISRKIIAGHNGTIWAENIPDQGVLFKFILSNQQKLEHRINIKTNWPT